MPSSVRSIRNLKFPFKINIGMAGDRSTFRYNELRQPGPLLLKLLNFRFKILNSKFSSVHLILAFLDFPLKSVDIVSLRNNEGPGAPLLARGNFRG